MPALRSAHRFAVDTEVTAPFRRARAAPAPCGPRPHTRVSHDPSHLHLLLKPGILWRKMEPTRAYKL